jgi:hypothetical protein
LEVSNNGDQHLNLWVIELKDVLEIMEDPIFKGKKNFHLVMDLN